MSWLRYLLAGSLALVTTFGLFIFMQRLVGLAEAMLKEPPRYGAIEFVRLKQESQTQTKERVLPSKPSQVEQPKTPKLELPQIGASGALAVAAPTLEFEQQGPIGPTREGLGVDLDNVEAVPIVRVEPIYPASAAENGVEGWVLVAFEIDSSGSVKNPRVVASEPKRVFDQAALIAVSTWKYKPMVKDGRPVTKREKVRLTFKLERQ